MGSSYLHTIFALDFSSTQYKGYINIVIIILIIIIIVTVSVQQKQMRENQAWPKFIGSRALSFKRPLLSVDVDVCGYVRMHVCMSATLRSNISETIGDRGSVSMGAYRKGQQPTSTISQPASADCTALSADIGLHSVVRLSLWQPRRLELSITD